MRDSGRDDTVDRLTEPALDDGLTEALDSGRVWLADGPAEALDAGRMEALDAGLRTKAELEGRRDIWQSN